MLLTVSASAEWCVLQYCKRDVHYHGVADDREIVGGAWLKCGGTCYENIMREEFFCYGISVGGSRRTGAMR
jgi:hypothetical protein